MKGDDYMRYESFYPFSQPRVNDFFNFNGSPPVNSSPPPNMFGFGAPNNVQGTQPNNFLGRLQQGIGAFQHGNPGASGGFGGFGGPGGPGGPGGAGGFGGLFGGPGGAPGAGGGAGLQQAAGTSKAMSYLQTADKFLNTAQQITPMVRQYAPMLQNVPALWKLYRGFQAIPSTTAAVSNVSAAAGAPSVARTVASAVTNGASLPRIFQPPI